MCRYILDVFSSKCESYQYVPYIMYKSECDIITQELFDLFMFFIYTVH